MGKDKSKVDNKSFLEASPQGSMCMFAAVMYCCLSPILFGFSLGFTSPTQNVMQGNRVPHPETGKRFHPPHNLIMFTEAEENLYAAMLNVGAVIGAFSGAALGEKLGRAKTLSFTAIPHFISWTWTCFIATGSAHILIFLRLLLGFAVGVGSAVTPSYIGEISTTEYRGALGAANQLSVTIGIFLAAMVGKYFFLEEKHDVYFTQWRYMSLMGSTLSVLLAGAFLLPDSPSWLAKNKGEQAAKRSLKQLRTGKIETELKEIMESANAEKRHGDDGEQESVISKLFGEYRKSFIIGVGLCFAQQLSGVNAVIFFTVDIAKSAGMGNPRMMAMYVMCFQVFMTGVAVLLMEKAGRRGLLLFAGTGMAIALFLLAGFYHMKDGFDACEAADGSGCSKPPSLLALAGLYLFIGGFSLSLGPVPWLMLAEVFPNDVRGTAASIATAVNWGTSFCITLGFAPMVEAMGSQGVFALFGAIVTLVVVFVFAMVPETKGLSVEAVLELLRGEDGSASEDEDSDSESKE